jgi:hypothetical protein
MGLHVPFSIFFFFLFKQPNLSLRHSVKHLSLQILSSLSLVVPKKRKKSCPLLPMGENRRKKERMNEHVTGENERAVGEMNAGREGDVPGGNEEGFEELAMQFS